MQYGWIQDGKIQDGMSHEWVTMSENYQYQDPIITWSVWSEEWEKLWDKMVCQFSIHLGVTVQGEISANGRSPIVSRQNVMQSPCDARASTSNMEIQTVSALPTFIFSADALVKLGMIYIQLTGLLHD